MNRHSLKKYLKAARRLLKPNSDSLYSLPASELSKYRDILDYWKISEFQIRKTADGSSANFIIVTSKGKFILKNAGAHEPYINFQNHIIDKLSEYSFPYSVPRPLKVNGHQHVQHKGHFWLLYEFVKGQPVGWVFNKAQAKNMGSLVAQYHQIGEKIDFSQFKDSFNLQIFNKEDINLRLQENVDLMVKNAQKNKLDELLFRTSGRLLESYNNIPEHEIKNIKELPKIPIYNDWHGYNIIKKNNKIIGVIDFDSVCEATRIVDFQNALMYSAKIEQGLDPGKMRSFVEGYFKVLKLSNAELSFTHSLMLDRLASLITNILEERRLKKSQDKDSLAFFFIDLYIWLVNNKEKFLNYLFNAAGRFK